MLKEATTKQDRDGFLDDPLALAIAVFLDRVQRLDKEDRSDLLELSEALFCAETEEEQKAAAWGMREILEQTTGKVRRMEFPVEPPSDLESWLGSVSQRLRDARKAAGLTQEELAAKSGIPQSHISRLESGKHSPSAMTLEKIAAALKISESEFDPSA